MLLSLSDQRLECERTSAQWLCVVRGNSRCDALSPGGLPQGQPKRARALTDTRSAQVEINPRDVVVTDEHRGTSIRRERVVEQSGAVANVAERHQQPTPFEVGDVGQPA
jgi:hypothetical protein